MLRSVEIHDIRIAHFMPFFTRQKAGRIISADFHIACSTWSSTILLSVDGNQDRLDSLLEIRTHRRTVDNQQSILCRFDSQAGRRSEHHRTQIERGPCSVGGNISFIPPNDLDAGINDHFDGRQRKAKTFGRRPEAAGIVLDTEQADFPIDSTKSLETLEKFDAIMQARSRHVHLDVLVARNLHITPFTIRKIITDVDVGLVIVEPQGAPIYIFHYSKI